MCSSEIAMISLDVMVVKDKSLRLVFNYRLENVNEFIVTKRQY